MIIQVKSGEKVFIAWAAGEQKSTVTWSVPVSLMLVSFRRYSPVPGDHCCVILGFIYMSTLLGFFFFLALWHPLCHIFHREVQWVMSWTVFSPNLHTFCRDFLWFLRKNEERFWPFFPPPVKSVYVWVFSGRASPINIFRGLYLTSVAINPVTGTCELQVTVFKYIRVLAQDVELYMEVIAN